MVSTDLVTIVMIQIAITAFLYMSKTRWKQLIGGASYMIIGMSYVLIGDTIVMMMAFLFSMLLGVIKIIEVVVELV